MVHPEWAVGLSGFATGAVCGFALRRGRLCTFGAIEDWVTAGDTRRLKVFALGLAIALAGTQGLVLAGLLDPAATTYVPAALPLLSIALGGLLFGIGMSLIGTCGIGSLVRLGGGDLRSLVVILVFGAVAYASLRGILSGFRIGTLEAIQVPLPDGRRADLADMAQAAIGPLGRPALAGALLLGLAAWALSDRRLARTPRLVGAGAALGLGVVAGWVATGVLVDEFATPRPQSLTFVGPVARALFGIVAATDSLADFGVASVFGVVAGSGLAAVRGRQFHWEAFDDPREMRRHLLGAALMGFGGVAAGGCTIGQGLTAGSLLALSWPVALAGIFLGARLGIYFVLEGRLSDALRDTFPRVFRRTQP
ncbi:YeeE/YedE family protein [Prosthecomicrobium sp. N25]|uniref:YeeE/YedE family protein n=1 Tax=Prosthecomicrobium sp. N25 TaxID=3129254 RepID=UPI003078636E